MRLVFGSSKNPVSTTLLHSLFEKVTASSAFILSFALGQFSVNSSCCFNADLLHVAPSNLTPRACQRGESTPACPCTDGGKHLPAGPGRQATQRKKLCGVREVDKGGCQRHPNPTPGSALLGGAPSLPRPAPKRSTPAPPSAPPVLSSRRLRAKGPVLASPKHL